MKNMISTMRQRPWLCHGLCQLCGLEQVTTSKVQDVLSPHARLG